MKKKTLSSYIIVDQQPSQAGGGRYNCAEDEKEATYETQTN